MAQIINIQANEDLNLESCKVQLIIKALNKYRYKWDAATALGISLGTLERYRKAHNIVKEYDTWFVVVKEKRIVNL